MFFFSPPPQLFFFFPLPHPELSCFTGKLRHLEADEQTLRRPRLESFQTYAEEHAGHSLPRASYYQTYLSWWHTPHLDCIISSLLSLRSDEQHAAIGFGSGTNKPAIMLAFCGSHTQTGGRGLVLPLAASQLTAFTLNEVPRQFAICAGQIKTVHQGVFGPGASDNSSRISSLPQFITIVLFRVCT